MPPRAHFHWHAGQSDPRKFRVTQDEKEWYSLPHTFTTLISLKHFMADGLVGFFSINLEHTCVFFPKQYGIGHLLYQSYLTLSVTPFSSLYLSDFLFLHLTDAATLKSSQLSCLFLKGSDFFISPKFRLLHSLFFFPSHHHLCIAQSGWKRVEFEKQVL